MKVSSVVLDLTGHQTKAQLARDLDVRPAAITGWDIKGKLPPMRALQISRKFGVSIDKLEKLTLI